MAYMEKSQKEGFENKAKNVVVLLSLALSMLSVYFSITTKQSLVIVQQRCDVNEIRTDTLEIDVSIIKNRMHVQKEAKVKAAASLGMNIIV